MMMGLSTWCDLNFLRQKQRGGKPRVGRLLLRRSSGFMEGLGWVKSAPFFIMGVRAAGRGLFLAKIHLLRFIFDAAVTSSRATARYR